jgi:hypothetical protein
MGYGTVRPIAIGNPADPGGAVIDVAWQSWGGATATGKGTSEYLPEGSTANPTKDPATVVAFDLGTLLRAP